MSTGHPDIPLVMDHPFTPRRSQHFWAHENMTISTDQPESLNRMRHPTGEGGPGPYRWDHLTQEAR